MNLKTKTNTLFATLAMTGVMGLSTIADAKPDHRKGPPPHSAAYQHSAEARRIAQLETENNRLRAQLTAMSRRLSAKEHEVRIADQRASAAESRARRAQEAEGRVAQLLNELRESRRREAAAMNRAREAEARYAALNERMNAFEKKAGFAVRMHDWNRLDLAVRWLTEDEQWMLSQASY